MNASQTEAEPVDAQVKTAEPPTYGELLSALRALEWACSGVKYMESEYAVELGVARALLSRVNGSP